MRLLSRLAAVALVAAAIFISQSSRATLITVSFSGQVEFVSGVAVGGPFDVGDPVTGQFSYQTAGAVPRTMTLSEATYDPGVIQSFEVQIGDYLAIGAPQLLFPQNRVSVESQALSGPSAGLFRDQVTFRTSVASPAVNGVDPSRLQFFIENVGPTKILPSVDLPSVDSWLALTVALPQVATGPSVNHLIFGDNGAVDRVDWTVTSYSVVPEPGMALLVGLGMVALGVCRSGRGRAAGEALA